MRFWKIDSFLWQQQLTRHDYFSTWIITISSRKIWKAFYADYLTDFFQKILQTSTKMTVFYIFSANFGPYFNHRFGPNLIMPMLSRICGKPFPFNLFSFYLKENDIKPEKKFFIGIIKNCLNELFCMRNVFAWIYHGKSKLKS